ncbi:AraC family transcriptional regulator [Lutimaribacter marinistellae]|uniref:AraC family transcriptional regulator n=1 Tax=Lutimaribacter marinistellae TaxID=1820329 RepID=A0ABV7TD86_9RHOB
MTRQPGPFDLSLGQGAILPLAGHRLFSSADVDEARARVARVYCDHRLDVVRGGTFSAVQNRIEGRSLSVNIMTYGSKTMIAPGALERFFLFQFPIRGHASVSNGDNIHEIGGGRSGVLNPDAETCMIWSEDCVQVMIQVERTALEALARTRFGLPAGAALRFAGSNALSHGSGRAFAGLLEHVVREADFGCNLFDGPDLMAEQVETTLMVGLLQSQSHNLSDVPAPAAGPRAVRLAEAFMTANLGNPITLEVMAAEAGVSPRALQSAFRESRGRSPMTVLREMRLEQAWQDLSHPGPNTSVTDVATALGFFHLGRFGQQYRAKFGCSPIETLRRARQA